jgi:hypothetical protein
VRAKPRVAEAALWRESSPERDHVISCTEKMPLNLTLPLALRVSTVRLRGLTGGGSTWWLIHLQARPLNQR